MDQQALEDVASTAQMQASHSAGVIHVGEGPFDEFGPAFLQSTGVDMSFVSELVLYDVPESRTSLSQVLGRFDRLGRERQLKVYLLSEAGHREKTELFEDILSF